ncbi:hypothetical protein RMATCC62417_00186 [Rhizopus microsporus]|nr:hypothetical protein RMATCC62417_00186 [Rhizopus microsporus]
MSDKGNAVNDLQDATKKMLPKHFKSIYEATRIALDLKTIETKLNNLSQIRERLSRESKAPESLKSMDDAMKDIENEINSKKKELTDCEELASNQFRDIIQHISNYTDKIKSSVSVALAEFSEKLLQATTDQLTNSAQSIEKLNKEKMDMAEGQKIYASLEEFKKHVKESHNQHVMSIGAQNEKTFRDVVKKMENMLSNFEQTEVINKVSKLVIKQLEAKVYERVKQISEENKRDQTKETVGSEQIIEIVKNEVNARLGPTNLKNIMATLPEVQLMVNFCKKVSPNAGGVDQAELASVKEAAMQLGKEHIQIKQKLEETRSIVDSLRSKSLPGQPSSDTEVASAALLANVQQMEQNVAFMYNHIKMIDTSFKAQRDSADGTIALPRKRARTDDASELDVHARLEEIENKHQKLLDFILQCKDNVLDEMFPVRLEAAMKKIEQILINHETFIAFIIDPFSTKKRKEERAITNLPEDQYLNPAMIDCIQQLVKKATEEATAPLYQQIKSLEEQLSKKQ